MIDFKIKRIVHVMNSKILNAGHVSGSCSKMHNKNYNDELSNNSSALSLLSLVSMDHAKVFRNRECAPLIKLTVFLGNTYLDIGKVSLFIKL